MEFQTIIRDYYSAHRRDLPWRVPEEDGRFDAYKILVSEVMLQQTQVPRVVQKYLSFLKRFTSVSELAGAPFSSVLAEWSGLGYNRRAKFLHQAAKKIVGDYQGIVPKTSEELQTLPGIGYNTAAAIVAYAYNKPVIFIETNIRTVYIHHFFHDEVDVDDKSIRKVVKQTLDIENPREWYWALMDYGSFLKKTIGNVSQKSKHFVKQSAFEGSKRELRARVLRELLKGKRTKDELLSALNDKRLSEVLTELVKEAMVTRKNNYYQIA